MHLKIDGIVLMLLGSSHFDLAAQIGQNPKRPHGTKATPQCFTQQNWFRILEEIVGAWLSCENLLKLSRKVKDVMASRFVERVAVAWMKISETSVSETSVTILRNAPLPIFLIYRRYRAKNCRHGQLQAENKWKDPKWEDVLGIVIYYVLFINIFLRTSEILLVWLETTTIKWILQ